MNSNNVQSKLKQAWHAAVLASLVQRSNILADMMRRRAASVFGGNGGKSMNTSIHIGDAPKVGSLSQAALAAALGGLLGAAGTYYGLSQKAPETPQTPPAAVVPQENQDYAVGLDVKNGLLE